MSCGLVLGGSGQAPDLEVFKTSSGNIVCELDNGEVDCFIKSGLKPAPRKERRLPYRGPTFVAPRFRTSRSSLPASPDPSGSIHNRAEGTRHR